MKNNIKAGLLGLAAMVLFGAQIALGATLVQVGDKIKFADGPGASPGGAFILTDYGSTGTIAQGSFQSFCLEKNEYISYSPAVFNVSAISNEARAGGAGGRITTPYPHDPLDVRTAWLYTQYIENPNALNAVNGWSALSVVDKGTAMQQAIWSIEQEIGGVTGVASALITAAGAAGWSDTGRVHVLNLTWWSGGGSSYPTGTFAQDQLYITPVPEPEIYAMMGLGLGLMGFVARRRKQSAA